MTPVPASLRKLLPIFAAIAIALLVFAFAPQVGHAQDEEPIAYTGHGGLFDRTGRQIVPTAEFVEEAQGWYRRRLLAQLPAEAKADFERLDRRLGDGLDLKGQNRLIARQRGLRALIAKVPRTVSNGRILAKLNALEAQLQWRLPRRENLEELRSLEPFQIDPRLAERLKQPGFGPGISFLVTPNSGQAYMDECAAADVPVPPAIGDLDPNGTAGWKTLGFIPRAQQFIVGSPAELRVFESPKGMCFALPRYSSSSMTTVSLDGVICLSKTTAKTCFWDNSMNNGPSFSFPAGTQIPIGVADLNVDPQGRYQAGGAEIEFADGGQCTDCHAGENPFIIHPDSDLGAGLFMSQLNEAPLNLPTFGPDRYVPLVGASWPQNTLSQTPAFVPGGCNGCHQKGGAGRFPHLVPELQGYCNTVLAGAIQGRPQTPQGPGPVPATMPQGAPGTLAGTVPVNDFRAWCGVPGTSGPSNRGDPHLTTTNGINYDFQAAGEFVSLRNSSNGFELQTRQSPVLTSFTPGANAYTGLASCVSLNTAAALRVGKHRITYQPARTRGARPEDMQLKIDGRAVVLPRTGRNLGGANRIAATPSGGGLDVRLEDGTRVLITPNFWASQGYWYLNVEVLNTPAREGTMGHILGADWLPRRPDGSSFGPAPASLPGRHGLLNGIFADAWRVSPTNSLFDYAAGTSTASFTNRGWPPAPGGTCTAIRGNPIPGGQPRRPVKPINPEVAIRLCRPIQDKAAFDNCVFDLTIMGDPNVAEGYRRTLGLRMGAP